MRRTSARRNLSLRIKNLPSRTVRKKIEQPN
ncbi:MAG: hypothetical protein EOP48_03105 [Sphingobacteriales bacterium]|nr:MAG: hypothetical protein EOP48_03105 [Sphingobacteriales bacterium]